mmetsp:Transcript_9462/g.15570  ORF Transcript_9462/g.15570 Transcript_9462/m.15570 type:complete len:151 (-) Transcript_9462:185-637(-)
MFRLVVLFAVLFVAVAFTPARVQRTARTELSMASDFQKAFSATLIGASLFLGQSARAEIDYEGVKYLGGGEKIDLNNANVRAYLKVPGLYPGAAGKIVTNGPYKSVSDVYNIPGLTNAEKDAIKKSESRFLVLEGKPEYVIDKINNGLYR